MGTSLIPKPIMILAGVVVLVIAIIIGVLQVAALADEFSMMSKGYIMSSDFGEDLQYIVLLMINIFQVIMGIMCSLAYIVPVWAGRKLFKTGYSLSDDETVPKAYRSGGISLVIVGAIAIAVYAWILDSYIIILPIVLLALGVLGIFGSITRKS